VCFFAAKTKKAELQRVNYLQEMLAIIKRFRKEGLRQDSFTIMMNLKNYILGAIQIIRDTLMEGGGPQNVTKTFLVFEMLFLMFWEEKLLSKCKIMLKPILFYLFIEVFKAN
jgi:hypothetical protein